MYQNERELEYLVVLPEWIYRCADDTRRLWKITECNGRVRKYKKGV